jgi:hypothetical protein
MGLEYKLRSLLKLNLKLFFDMHFLREGAYVNVGSGQQFYDGNDMSLLLPDVDSDDGFVGVVNGQIWQSPFRQWVYESGVALDGTNLQAHPIIASGLFIEGAFRPTNDPEFGHTIDFIEGRIIFDNPQSLSLKVQAEFCAREVRIDFEHAFNQQFQIGVLGSQYFTNPVTSQQIVYPSGVIESFPAVFIEIDGRNMKPYELGNRSAIIKEQVKLHVWAQHDLQRDNIIDVLSAQWRKPIPIIDFNMAPLPLSGIFNTLSPEYVPYQNLLRNNKVVTSVGSGTPVRFTAYLSDIDVRNEMATEEYERATVTFEVEVYLNAPITPLGSLFGPISTLPTIEDSGF